MFDLQQYLVKQQAGFFKTNAAYDIINPSTQKPLAVAKEAPSGTVKFLRLFMGKKSLPTNVEFRDPSNNLTLSLYRPFKMFGAARVNVNDGDGTPLGYFKGKMFSLTSGFWVYDPQDKQVAEVKGNWKGKDFRFLTPDGKELGQVTKQWAGMAKELFTSADNYVVVIGDNAKGDPKTTKLLLAAALAIDIIFYE